MNRAKKLPAKSNSPPCIESNCSRGLWNGAGIFGICFSTPLEEFISPPEPFFFHTRREDELHRVEKWSSHLGISQLHTCGCQKNLSPPCTGSRIYLKGCRNGAQIFEIWPFLQPFREVPLSMRGRELFWRAAEAYLGYSKFHWSSCLREKRIAFLVSFLIQNHKHFLFRFCISNVRADQNCSVDV